MSPITSYPHSTSKRPFRKRQGAWSNSAWDFHFEDEAVLREGSEASSNQVFDATCHGNGEAWNSSRFHSIAGSVRFSFTGCNPFANRSFSAFQLLTNPRASTLKNECWLLGSHRCYPSPRPSLVFRPPNCRLCLLSFGHPATLQGPPLDHPLFSNAQLLIKKSVRPLCQSNPRILLFCTSSGLGSSGSIKNFIIST